jgi:hypothetical protein
MEEEVAAGYCQVFVQGGYTQAKNISLGERLEVLDAELVAIHQALCHGTNPDLIHPFTAGHTRPLLPAAAYTSVPWHSAALYITCPSPPP